ncbi:hypothetical protein [Arsenicibacter rosenii]|uniref:Uncharacterized protein n=1 Tax=Arsenicibacter rosenii TaxID=1750698 RepID=A0A1S2VB82_9BACT|nr:hypothetical protein [Arsenicibacter rosenii]OIN55565.1 hypothetical protein BLX24_29470 [Arsenicibacter rosenii]
MSYLSILNVLIVAGFGMVQRVSAQPHINLRMTFNTESNRYEVYVKPNFTQKQYTWGPSQITVVLPESIANKSIDTRSNAAGLWLDQSMVFSPASSPEYDFHGFATQGGKVNMIAGEEQLLFDFRLSEGYQQGVRFFEPDKDPSSTEAGMTGGDFRSYVSNVQGTGNIVIHGSEAVPDKISPDLETVSIEKPVIVAYPNPVISGTFRLFLKGFDPIEVVNVQIVSVSGKLLRHFDEQVSTLSGRPINMSFSSDPFIVVNVSRPGKQQSFSHKLFIRE